VRVDPSEFTVLRTAACRANIELARRGLARFTFGNASAIDRELGVVAIKPSGVPYDDLDLDAIVLVDLETGAVQGGELRPSSDAQPTAPSTEASPESAASFTPTRPPPPPGRRPLASFRALVRPTPITSGAQFPSHDT
jgi:hypothetical protein